jgi:acetyl-CoA carboxylase carboxyl transferase subunit alpha
LEIIYLELHGDRGFKDDKMIDRRKNRRSVVYDYWAAKGYNTKTRQYRNLEWPILRDIVGITPNENGREICIPVVTLIDTWCHPELRRPRSKQLQKYFEMVRLKVPIITIIVGEGAQVELFE